MRLLLPSELVSNTFKLYCLQCCVGLEINHNDVFTKKCRKKNCALFNKHYELFQSENNHLFIVCLKCKTNIDITRYSNNDFFNYASFPTYKGYLYLRLSKIQKNRKMMGSCSDLNINLDLPIKELEKMEKDFSKKLNI